MTAGLALAVALAAPSWEFVGISASGLRMFVDRSSIRAAGPLTDATIRLGSPRAIVGRIVTVIEHQQIDCPGSRWRMLRYEAFDEAGAVVKRAVVNGALLPVEANRIGAAIYDAVCASAPAPAR